jgi:surface antigen
MVNEHRISPGIMLAVAVTALSAGGCDKTVGGKLGATLGQIGGSYVSRAGIPDNGVVAAMTEQMGGIIGEEIAKYLNPEERKQAEGAAESSINSDVVGPKSTRTWSSQTNPDVSGGSTVLASKVGADGRECRTQRNYVNVKGKDVEQTETLCRDPKSGAWVTGAA